MWPCSSTSWLRVSDHLYFYIFTPFLMSPFCYRVALLLSMPLGSMAQSTLPDSSAVSRRHLLTAHTLHVAAPFIPALGYEALVRPRWGVRGSLGVERDGYRYQSSYTEAGMRVTGRSEYRYTGLLADASLNYYLQAQKPALMGWFVGAGFVTEYSYSRLTNTGGPFPSETRRHFAVRPLLRGGRHWTLGQRWVLDTHVAVAPWSRTNRPLYVKLFTGIGAGYRF
jgi:hypothetical protein